MWSRGRLHHVAVVVADVARSEQFYVDLLGLTVRARHIDDEGRLRATWLDLGDAFLALERGDPARPPRHDEAPGWHCVALSIEPDQREPLRGRLEAAGVPIERESPFSMYVRDPDGTLVAFSHHPHTRSQP